MSQVNRREFLKMGGALAAVMGLGAQAAPRLAEALELLADGREPVLWLQGQSCSGCSVSMLNTFAPSPVQLLTQYISLGFHSTLSTATGETAMEVVEKRIEAGGFILAVEGSIPADMPEACVMGGLEIGPLVERAARRAKAVLAVGACASFGGIPSAEGNPTGAKSAPDFLQEAGVPTPCIRIPGCPAHPDWTVGTIAHVVAYGLPETDDYGRPKMFYGRLIHEQCPHYPDYERRNFAKTFGDDGCLFKLGCLGPNTHADCTWRHWNGGVNTCIRAGAPCIGCASEDFAKSRDFPFYTKSEASR